MPDLSVADLTELHENARRCAELAGLVYIEGDPPGIRRQRRGKGFSYHEATHTAIDPAARARCVELAIPPAWQQVWICADENGHLLATGQDDRGRKQYIYHPRWRELRDVVNAYRLLVLAQALPKIRAHVQTQLRRRTLDRDRVIAGMIGILDAAYLRIGNVAYAEENESFGLSTLTPEHVEVHRKYVVFSFPAKSGKDAVARIDDVRIARLVTELVATPHERLFTVDGVPIDSSDVNAALGELCGERITAKDFRTWGGTLAAFTYLREHRDSDRPASKVAVEAVDEAADTLRNTRAVARSHYVHPQLLHSYLEGSFGEYLPHTSPTPTPYLQPDEQALVAVLQRMFTTEFPAAHDLDPP
ncbi:MAG: DNA topoisomerase IB [Mycobacteriaceae bacterium]